MRRRTFLIAAAATAAGELDVPVARAETAPDAPVARAETAQEIIEKVDRVRNPGKPFRVTTTLVEYVDGAPANKSVVEVFAKEDDTTRQFNNLVRFVEPPRDEGKLILYYASKMWFYDPESKASVRISPQQRLIGQASDGDVLMVNLAKDYDGTLLGDERIDDAGREKRNCWRLRLAPVSEDAVYAQIEYWIEHGTYYPVKGKYYADSGRLLKVAYFRNLQYTLGGWRPADTIILDAVDVNQVTTMSTSDWRFEDIPDAWFQRDFLPHFKVD